MRSGNTLCADCKSCELSLGSGQIMVAGKLTTADTPDTILDEMLGELMHG